MASGEINYIKIYNNCGNRKIRQIINYGLHEVKMHVAELPAGLYFLSVQGQNWSKTEKIIKCD